MNCKGRNYLRHDKENDSPIRKLQLGERAQTNENLYFKKVKSSKKNNTR